MYRQLNVKPTKQQIAASAHKTQQGNQWVPVTWDGRNWVHGYARDYFLACAAVREHRERVSASIGTDCELPYPAQACAWKQSKQQ